jgi:hypothetical protein
MNCSIRSVLRLWSFRVKCCRITTSLLNPQLHILFCYPGFNIFPQLAKQKIHLYKQYHDNSASFRHKSWSLVKQVVTQSLPTLGRITLVSMHRTSVECTSRRFASFGFLFLPFTILCGPFFLCVAICLRLFERFLVAGKNIITASIDTCIRTFAIIQCSFTLISQLCLQLFDQVIQQRAG